MTKRIDLNKIAEAYYRSTSRLIFLDYDGTLVPFQLDPEHIKAGANVKCLLYSLADDPRNSVVLISGRDRKYLDGQWPNPPMTMVAEHGAFYRNGRDTWRKMFSISPDWIPKTLPALKALTAQHPGSFVEEKTYSIAWHYRAIQDQITDGDKRQILAAIRSLPERHDFKIYDCEYTIELRTIGIQKGAFASLWASGKYYDFVMAIGDGQTDEDLFKILDKNAYSIKVGNSNTSEAVYHLTSQTEVVPFLQSILDFGPIARKLNVSPSFLNE